MNAFDPYAIMHKVAAYIGGPMAVVAEEQATVVEEDQAIVAAEEAMVLLPPQPLC